MDLDWMGIKELFGDAIELSDSGRVRYLDDACRGQPEVRAEVKRLLGESRALTLASDDPHSIIAMGQVLLASGDVIEAEGQSAGEFAPGRE